MQEFCREEVSPLLRWGRDYKGNSLAEAIFASAATSQLVTYRSLFRTSPAISRTPKLTFFYNRGLIIDGHEWSMARAQFLTS
jgi:hypothetical protein